MMASNAELIELLRRSDDSDNPTDIKRYVPQHYMMMEATVWEWVRYEAFARLATRVRELDTALAEQDYDLAKARMRR